MTAPSKQPAVAAQSVAPAPARADAEAAAVADYVDRFTAAEVAAGYLPSPSLARLCAYLDRQALRQAQRRRRGPGDPFAFEQRRVADGSRRPAAVDHTPGRRKRSDQVAALLGRGRITRRQYEAALEIRQAYAAIQRSLFPRRLPDIQVDVSRRERLPMERWHPREARIIRRRYGPWKRAMLTPVEIRLADRRLRVGNALEIVMDLVWDNYGPRQVDDRHELRRGSATRVVGEGLQRYVTLAGWG